MRKDILTLQKELLKCLRPQKVTCREAKTDWYDEQKGMTWSLSHHDITCQENEVLNEWKMESKDDKQRFIYKCCKISGTGDGSCWTQPCPEAQQETTNNDERDNDS